MDADQPRGALAGHITALREVQRAVALPVPDGVSGSSSFGITRDGGLSSLGSVALSRFSSGVAGCFSPLTGGRGATFGTVVGAEAEADAAAAAAAGAEAAGAAAVADSVIASSQRTKDDRSRVFIGVVRRSVAQGDVPV